MDAVTACLIAEGMTVVETREEWIEAYQFLLDSGIIYHLQGHFQRTASDLIESGEIG